MADVGNIGGTMTTTCNKCMMSSIMRAASDLINTYDSALSDGAIKTRMLRISEDLIYAVNECDDMEV